MDAPEASEASTTKTSGMPRSGTLSGLFSLGKLQATLETSPRAKEESGASRSWLRRASFTRSRRAERGEK